MSNLERYLTTLCEAGYSREVAEMGIAEAERQLASSFLSADRRAALEEDLTNIKFALMVLTQFGGDA